MGLTYKKTEREIGSGVLICLLTFYFGFMIPIWIYLIHVGQSRCHLPRIINRRPYGCCLSGKSCGTYGLKSYPP